MSKNIEDKTKVTYWMIKDCLDSFTDSQLNLASDAARKEVAAEITARLGNHKINKENGNGYETN